MKGIFSLKVSNATESASCFDNLSTGHIETIQKLSKFGDLEFIQGDLRNTSDIKKVFEAYNINSVIHFAALSLVQW